MLPRVSKLISRRFDPVTCCRGSVNLTVINQTKRSLLSIEQKRELLMIPNATRLSLHYRAVKMSQVDSQQLTNHTIDAVRSGSLHSFSMFGHAHEQSYTMLVNVLSAAPNGHLLELHIDLVSENVSDNVFTQSQTFFSQSWNDMKQCRQLKYLFFKVDRNDRAFESMCSEPFAALPNSLKELTIDFGVMIEPLFLAWKILLQSTEYLPLLEKFSIAQNFDDDHYDEEIAHVITTTIMSQTNKIRPICHWRAGTSLDNIRSFPLKYLSLRVLSPETEQLLLQCPSDMWPDLKILRMCVQVQKRSNYFLTMCTLLLLRNITELDLVVGDRVSCVDLEGMIFPALRFLRLRFQCHSNGNLFLVGSLPNLEALHVHHPQISLTAVENVLKAASNCRQVTMSYVDTISLTLVLAMTLHCCRYVVIADVTVGYRDNDHHQHVEDVSQAFELYPLDLQHMQHLVRISHPVHEYCNAAFHLLIRHLSSAPLLQIFNSRKYGSLLQLRIVASLLHLRKAPLDYNQESLPKIFHMQQRHLLSKCTERLPIPFISPLEARRRDSIFHQSVDLGQLVVTDPMLTGTIELMSMPASVPVFRQESNNSGIPGRQYFEEYVRQRLSKQERAHFLSWDSGDYSSCLQRDTLLASRMACRHN